MTILSSIPVGGSLRVKILALCLALTLPAANAQTAPPAPGLDVLTFSNGDQLTGTLLRGVDDFVVFKSDMAGEITVPLAKIKELRSASNFVVLRKNVPAAHTTVQPGTIAVADGALTVSTPNSPSQSIPHKEVAYIINDSIYQKQLAGHTGFQQGWNGSITAGATLVRSTQNGSNVTAAVSAVRSIPMADYLPRRNRTIFNLTEAYGELTQPFIPQTVPATPDSVAKTNIFHSDIEQDQYFTPHFYALVNASFDHNYSQGLDLQQIYGAGLGWTPFETSLQQLDLTGEIHYEKQFFQASSNDQDLVGATFAEGYRRILPGKLVFTESASFLPAFNNSNAYSANFAAGLALPVYRRFSISFNTTDSYLNNPSFGFKKNSYQFVTGLTYTLY